jgi:hypothetical protein
MEHVQSDMEQQQTYTGMMRQVIASLTVDRERTLRDMTRVHADLLERSHDVAVHIGTSEDVPLEEALDVEQIATLASAADLLVRRTPLVTGCSLPKPRCGPRASPPCSMRSLTPIAPETRRGCRHFAGTLALRSRLTFAA